MCLAQGPQRSDAGEAWAHGPLVSSQALYHWATALLIHHTMQLTINKTLIGPQREKTCLWEFATTQAQTSLRIRAVWSAPLIFAFGKVPYVDLLQMKFKFSS